MKKSKAKKKKVFDHHYTSNNYGLNAGGLYNSMSGLGGSNDKSRGSVFLPDLISSRTGIEVIYNQSWAAKRFINLPIDQMFIKSRCFNTTEKKGNEQNILENDYKNYLNKYEVNTKIASTMKLARLYGSAFMILVTKESPLDTPLVLNNLSRNDLCNILVFDRFSVAISEKNYNIASRNYGMPDIYHIIPRYGAAFNAHRSRVVRIDGQSSLASDGWSVYDYDYGVSELIPVIQSIYQESQVSNAVSQLIEESSIPVMKSQHFRDALGASSIDAPSLADLTSEFNRMKSVYNMMFIDQDDDVTRLEVNMTGIKDLLNSFASRLAAAAGIPATVFLGKSPQGMNATGDSDLRINAMNIASMQQHKLKPIYDRLDDIFLITSGVGRIKFDYSFPSVLEDTEKEMADAAFVKTQIVTQLESAEIIDEKEARNIISGDPIIGDLKTIVDDDFATEFNRVDGEDGEENSTKDE